MPVGGVNGPNEKYVHPVYKNMDSAMRKSVDVVGGAVGGFKNKGKASDITKRTERTMSAIARQTTSASARAAGVGGLFGKHQR
jgi:hypothetical protein